MVKKQYGEKWEKIFDFGWIFFGEEIGVDILGNFFGEENIGEILFDTDSLPPFRWQALEKVPDDGDGSRDSQLGGRYRVINENNVRKEQPYLPWKFNSSPLKIGEPAGKMNMEATKHPFSRKENDQNQTSMRTCSSR